MSTCYWETAQYYYTNSLSPVSVNGMFKNDMLEHH